VKVLADTACKGGFALQNAVLSRKKQGFFLTPPYFPFCAASACLIFWSVLYWLKA
jgi:hypothetical protein